MLKRLNIRPLRTVRCVGWTSEEMGSQVSSLPLLRLLCLFLSVCFLLNLSVSRAPVATGRTTPAIWPISALCSSRTAVCSTPLGLV